MQSDWMVDDVLLFGVFLKLASTIWKDKFKKIVLNPHTKAPNFVPSQCWPFAFGLYEMFITWFFQQSIKEASFKLLWTSLWPLLERLKRTNISWGGRIWQQMIVLNVEMLQIEEIILFSKWLCKKGLFGEAWEEVTLMRPWWYLP